MVTWRYLSRAALAHKAKDEANMIIFGFKKSYNVFGSKLAAFVRGVSLLSMIMVYQSRLPLVVGWKQVYKRFGLCDLVGKVAGVLELYDWRYRRTKTDPLSDFFKKTTHLMFYMFANVFLQRRKVVSQKLYPQKFTFLSLLGVGKKNNKE